MKRILLSFLLFTLLGTADAEPYYMNIARDLEQTGDIASHTDDQTMRMKWVFNHPKWKVDEGIRVFLEDGEYGLEKREDSPKKTYYESRWLVQDRRQVPFELIGVDQIRTKMQATSSSLSEDQTEVVFTIQLQVQNEDRIQSGWVDRSERLARNYIWKGACSTGVSCRYPGNDGIWVPLIADYKNKKRHGVKGYELPPREQATEPPPATKVSDAPAPNTNTPSLADEIKKLKELLDSGAITPEEYEAAKARLLGK